MSKLKIPVGPDDHAEGDAGAPCTLVEYGDYECPHCGHAYPIVKRLQKHFGGRLRFVYRNFPLTEIHPHAEAAAESAEFAGAHGKFWAMHDLLFENQQHLSLKHLHAYAGQLSLDVARFTAEMDDGVYRQRVREHLESGRDSHVRATPGFFVNGVIVDVSFGMRALFEAVSASV